MAVTDWLRSSYNLIFTGANRSETGLLGAKPASGLRYVTQSILDHVLPGFDNAGGQTDRPVRYDGSGLLSCLLECSFPNLWRGTGRQTAVEDF